MTFPTQPSFKNLETLSKDPIDLTKEENFTDSRIEKMGGH